MASLNIRIPHQLASRLDFLSAETGRTKSYYVREALEEKLEDLEDYYLALKAIENISKGESRVWTQEEIERCRDL